MSDRAQIVASLTREPETRELAALPSAVSVLEVRADLCGDLDPDQLRQHFPGRVLYTLRSAHEGGRDRSEGRDRQTRILQGSTGYDLVDLEGDRDLKPAVLESISADRRLISWHGLARDVAGLVRKFLELSEQPAHLYKIVPTARKSGDEVAALQLLGELQRRDVVAFATGSLGTWTRHIAARMAAPWIFGSAGAEEAAPGQPTVAELIADYGYPEMPAVEAVCGVVGNPVQQSLSPRLHNAGYRALGLPMLYLAFGAERFADFWLEVVEEVDMLAGIGMRLVGLSVTTPFKTQALSVAEACSPLAERIGGSNTLILREDGWAADNTDAEGVVLAIEERNGAVKGRRAVVVGAGRAGWAGALGLVLAGATVTVANRSSKRGLEVAEALGLDFCPLEELDPSGFEIVVQATPLGRSAGDPLPINPDLLRADAVAADFVYSDHDTPFLAGARTRGLRVVEGREILLAQARRQFLLMSGQEFPPGLGRRVLGLENR